MRYVTTITPDTDGPTSTFYGYTLLSVLPGRVTRTQLRETAEVLAYCGEATLAQPGRSITVRDTMF